MKQIAVLASCIATSVAAQSPVPVREIGRLERVSTVPMQAVSAALPLRDGRVLVNDGRARRLVLLDSTLSHETVVADTMGTTQDDYARGSGEVLFRFRGDSALLVNISTQIALVIGPDGKRARVLAFPPPPGHPAGQQVTLGGRAGLPGTDGRGRLVYFYTTARTGFGITTLGLGMTMDSVGLAGMPILDRVFAKDADTATVLRVDLATRKYDTVAMLKIPLWRTVFRTDDSKGLIRIETTPAVFSVVDDYAIMPDGVIAVVRGLDYHIDWIEPNGRKTSTPKMSFDWQRLTDEQKTVAIDSVVKQMETQFNGSGSGGRGGQARPGAAQTAPNVAVRPALSDLPEYRAPFDRGDVRADADGNVWIRTSTIVKDRPVYDIVNRKGEVIDRVQLPSFRVITGFAPGVVFMAVTESPNVVRLERARVR